MQKYIITTSTGQVLSVQQPAFDNAITTGWDGDIYVQEAPSNISNEDLLTKYYWDFSVPALMKYPSLKPSHYYDWDGTAWIKDTDKFIKEIRAKRTNLLKQSDWTQSPDSPLTTEQRTAWATYRQELRDITDNLTGSEATIEDVLWPTPPTV